MSPTAALDIDAKSPPFDQLKNIRLLSPNRADAHARHQLYVGRDKASNAQMLVKVPTRLGLFYERSLSNEIDVLTTINRELPTSRVFPVVTGHGRLRDGRIFLMTYLFDQLPLAASVTTERIPSRTTGHIETTIEVARALTDLHLLPIYHVDLNPMNILHRVDRGVPVIRIVDFESAYDPARHTSGELYDPPTTAGYSAPEVSAHQTPDARSDVFSLGAVLYTMLAGFDWTWHGTASRSLQSDQQMDPKLRAILVSAVADDPGLRFESAAAFRDALATYLKRLPEPPQ